MERSKLSVIGKVILTGTLISGIAGWVEACSNSSDSKLDTGQKTETPGNLPSEKELTDSPTPEPTPILGYHEETDGIHFTTEKGEVLNVPQIEGLKASLQTTEDGQQKVIYTALEQNPYGMTPEQYAGEYKPNVLVEQAQTGGVVLKAPVVLRLINDKLTTLPELKDKWIIPLPFDITNTNIDNEVSLNFKKGYGNLEVPILEVNYLDSLPLINIIPNSSSLRIFTQGVMYHKWGAIDTLRLDETYAEITPGMEMHYIDLIGDTTPAEFTENTNIQSEFGDNIASAQGPIFISLTGLTNWYDIAPNKILSVIGKMSEVPVFLASNTLNRY